MCPGYCETQEEHELSKELLFCYVSSRNFYDASGGIESHIKRIKDWIHKVTSSRATLNLRYLHKSMRSVFPFCASAHEGTNFGPKNHTITMKANASLTTTVKVLAMQANMMTADLDQEVYPSMVKKDMKWSDLPTSTYIGTYTEGLLRAMMDRDGLYEAKRVGSR